MYVCVFVPRWIGISAVTAKKKKISCDLLGIFGLSPRKGKQFIFFNKNCSLTITNKKKKIKLNK